jgi:thiamine-monophosphate kinase
MKASQLGRGAEFDLIRELLREEPDVLPEGVVLGPGDDAAVVAGGSIVLSCDLSVEGVHFRREWMSVEEIGYRAVAGAVSDLAAMAARPVGILVSLALPAAEAATLVPCLRSGIAEACRLVDAAVLGGDLSRSPGGVLIDVTAVGEATTPVLRSGARPGDVLWVTGYLGGSGAAVRAWEAGEEPAAGARRAFVRPVPRTGEARWLAERVTLHALIDLSDGLAGDAAHLAAASGVQIVLEGAAVPVHRAATPELALRGGEDYELCFAAPAGAVDPLREEFVARFGVPLTPVGRVREGKASLLLASADGEDAALSSGGFDHFEEGEHEA